MPPKRARLKSALPPVATLASQRQVENVSERVDGGEVSPLTESKPRSAVAAEGGRTISTIDRTTTSKRRLQRRVILLDVLPPVEAGIRKVFDLHRFLLILGLTGAVLLLPTPAGLEPAGHRALALFIFTASILALEPAPLPIAALMVPIAQIALGIDQASGAFSAFGQPVQFLILGGLFLAEAMNKHGLIRRLALYTIVLSRGRLGSLLFGLMMVSGLLSMWVLNTATVAVLIPVGILIAQQVKPPEKAAQVLQLLLLAIAYSSSIGGMGTVLGGGENAIAASLLNQVRPFGFVDWLIYGMPIALLLLPLTGLLLQWVVPVGAVSIDTAPAVSELNNLGGLKAPEREILLVLVASALLWTTGSMLESAMNLPPTALSSAVVAIVAVAFLSVEEIVNWDDLRSVNWGVYFVIGAGLSLGDALAKTGASAWFASLLAPILQGLPYSLVVTLLVLVGFALTQLINNVPLGAVLAPVLITLGQASGTAPERLVLPAIMALAPAYMLPGASARMTLLAVTSAVTRPQMMRTGLLVGLPSALVILAYFLVLAWLGLI